MDSFTENPPPSTEDASRYRQLVRVFANLMRACDDPIDIQNLRNFRAETHDFQVAINMFAMLKARESSERYNMPERVRERKMQEEREKEEKEKERAAGNEREGRLQRYTLLGKEPGARTSDILASGVAEGVGLGIFTPRVVQGDDMGSSTPRVVEEDDSGSKTPRVDEITPGVVEGDDSGNETLLEGDGLEDLTPRVPEGDDSGNVTPRAVNRDHLGSVTPKVLEGDDLGISASRVLR